VLAESVFEGVRTKIKRLERAVASHKAEVKEAQAALAAARQEANQQLAAAEERHSLALGRAVAEGEDSLARHLAFIDRLMADKDELARQLAAAAEHTKVRCLAWLLETWHIFYASRRISR
jgi:5-azacytidine-induced protein 1